MSTDMTHLSTYMSFPNQVYKAKYLISFMRNRILYTTLLYHCFNDKGYIRGFPRARRCPVDVQAIFWEYVRII